MPVTKSLPKKATRTAFMQAAQKEGYLTKGAFKPLPKRNSEAYNKIIKHMK